MTDLDITLNKVICFISYDFLTLFKITVFQKYVNKKHVTVKYDSETNM